MLAIVVVAVVIAAAALTVALYEVSRGRPSTSSVTLPAGCVKPADGFLIIASNTGYNDSIGHGVPGNASNPVWWPVITVKQGQTVNITVCNTDFQSHGFEVQHYYDSKLNTIVPGQVLQVSFVASETGEFRIYCDIFCSIHIFMQNGLLNVTAS